MEDFANDRRFEVRRRLIFQGTSSLLLNVTKKCPEDPSNGKSKASPHIPPEAFLTYLGPRFFSTITNVALRSSPCEIMRIFDFMKSL